MRVYINSYRSHWLSPYTILEKVFFWREIDYDEPVIERWSARLQPLCAGLQTVLDWVHPKINYVKIDRWDTWSMDHTLAYIVLPMLKQLQKDKHGAPGTDDEDVPEHLRSTAAKPLTQEEQDCGGTDELWFQRWDWILSEMIWAFEQKVDDESDNQFHSGVHDTFWKPSEEVDEKGKPLTYTMEKGPNDTFEIDMEGLTAWEARKSNGFRLFGKYFQALWD